MKKPPENNIENPENENEETKQTEYNDENQVQQEADSIESQLTAVIVELEENKNKYLRLAAEYDNFRKRSLKERESLYSDAQAQTVTALLPVLDNLERAAAQPAADEALLKGIEMTLKQFYDCLSKLGVKEIEALGMQFDPNLHNAVMHVEQEGCDDNTIVEVFQKGFIMGEKVIRYSIVKVAN